MKNFLKNYLSTIIFILIAYLYFSNITFYQNFLIKDIHILFFNINIKFNSKIIYDTIIILYFILLIPFYLKYKEKSKARIIFNYLYKKIKKKNYKIKKKEKISLLAWFVKLFFAPLMIIWLTIHISNTLNSIYASYNDIYLLKTSFYSFFNTHLFWLILSFILFFDVLFFTLGYLIEIPKLKNTIKSVDMTFFGWFVVLICYPPFNTYSTQLLGWYSSEFPKFTNEYIHIILNFTILILMGIYSWASISLGLKASNLTNRGIITSGPYKYIRHPAYISKNLAWWIGGLPLLIGNITTGQYKNFIIVLFSIFAWSLIYYFRAITEEKHLNKDDDYKKYKQKVKYKFIPKVY